jgi:hypothetical protein
MGRNALPSGSTRVAISANRHVKYTCLRPLGDEFLNGENLERAFVFGEGRLYLESAGYPQEASRPDSMFVLFLFSRVIGFDGEDEDPLR